MQKTRPTFYGFTFSIAIFILSLGSVVGQDANVDKNELLTIGSKAPNLDIEHWLSDNGGKFKRVERFENGKVYMVEFWATWCGPCIASMPHIVELQKKYAAQGLRIISVSDEDLDTVEKFLQRPTAGEGTYGELTSGYCLTTDPDRSVSKTYMQAAGQKGIPTAFLVGKTGLIEWIGHPMEVDEPLRQVLSGEWDRKKFAVDFTARQKFEITLSKVSKLMRTGKTDNALALLNDTIKTTRSTGTRMQASMVRIQLLLISKNEKAAEAIQAFAKDTDDADVLNNIAWNVYQLAQQTDLKESSLVAAIACAKRATNLSPKSPHIWDTRAHLEHQLGELTQAIESQQKAVDLSEGLESLELQYFLDELKEEKADRQPESKTGK